MMLRLKASDCGLGAIRSPVGAFCLLLVVACVDDQQSHKHQRATRSQRGTSVEAAPFPDKLSVRDNRIVGSRGNPMVLRGVVLPDPIWQATGWDPWTRRHFEVVRQWGATVVRLPIHPGVFRRHVRRRSLKILDQAIGWAKECGLYVILDFHSIGFPPDERYEPQADRLHGELHRSSQKEIVQFWDLMSKRYRDHNVVAFYEVFNEPFRRGSRDVAADWKRYRAFAEQIIDRIRDNDADAVVIVGGLDHGYDLSQALRWPIQRSNVVYATHVYPDSSSKKPWEQAFGKLAQKHPVFATEIGFDPAGSDPARHKPEDQYRGQQPFREAIMAYLQKRAISWTAWCFSPTWRPSLIKSWDYTPTESGRFFRDRLLQKAAGSSSLPAID